MERRRLVLVSSVVIALLVATPVAAQWTTLGRVVALDPVRPAVTLDHGPIGDLLPPSRTEFPVSRAELLGGVVVGDVVRATLATDAASHGVLAVTRLEPDVPHRAGGRDGLLTAMIAIGAAALAGLLALWLQTRRLRRSVAEAGRALDDGLRRQAAAQRKLNADVEAATHALQEIVRTLASQLAAATSRVRLVRASRETAEAAAGPEGVALFVVRAGDVDTYRMLSERLAREGPGRVIWDRRRRDRRTAGSRVPQERRRRERRGEPAPTWTTLGYVAVSPAAGRRFPHVA
jgi:copper binding protein CusF